MHTKAETTILYYRSSKKQTPQCKGENVRFQQDGKLWKPGHIRINIDDHTFIVESQMATPLDGIDAISAR